MRISHGDGHLAHSPLFFLLLRHHSSCFFYEMSGRRRRMVFWSGKPVAGLCRKASGTTSLNLMVSLSHAFTSAALTLTTCRCRRFPPGRRPCHLLVAILARRLDRRKLAKSFHGIHACDRLFDPRRIRAVREVLRSKALHPIPAVAIAHHPRNLHLGRHISGCILLLGIVLLVVSPGCQQLDHYSSWLGHWYL